MTYSLNTLLWHLQRSKVKGWRQDLHLHTILQHFVMISRAHIVLNRNGTEDRNRQNSHPFTSYHFQKCEMNRGNVISSLLLPQPIVWLHLIVNNCWQNLRKPRSDPPPPLPPLFLPGPSSPRHITSFKNHWGAPCLTSAHFPHLLSLPIRSHSLRPRTRPISFHCVDFYTRVPSDVIAV